MNRKSGKGVILILFCVIILAIFLSIYFTLKKDEDISGDISGNKENIDNVYSDKIEDNESEKDQSDITQDNQEKNYEEFKFSTAYGEITITAEKAYTARGTAGASNIIFYLKDNKLYRYNNNGRDEIIADGVEDIYYFSDKTETLTVELNETSTFTKELSYIEYIIE